MRAWIAAFLLAASVTASADRGWRVGGDLLSVGDTMIEVLEVAGEPAMKNRIENRFRATAGHRWYYRERGYDAKTVIITFRGGRVSDIEVKRD